MYLFCIVPEAVRVVIRNVNWILGEMQNLGTSAVLLRFKMGETGWEEAIYKSRRSFCQPALKVCDFRVGVYEITQKPALYFAVIMYFLRLLF